uniref:Lon N-terminal domain-containing protein n=2 Tax=Lotharella oceanica TaxID=641309 RepID=A0A7S2U497_9EUKA|eukprot:CAMPEP_0170167758 /NCGR_PEP_ID=MMETSP0040_2-20121228/1069_1 /TAXON_ID=641309 /ORGANISM="Lotharella oceanica, Strain CCMP622" /LENGTH=375 /DNA_ID=CAMNT_0010405877 /DNA_START=273 /DNA_END=1400 /DNA_ORIENTATION=-
MDEDDDAYDPYDDVQNENRKFHKIGDEGILWAPESAKTATESEMLSQPSTVKEIVRMPLFPLNGVYIPGNTEVLNIYELKYRKMYNDILHNGSKRFAVAMINNGRITEYGTVLHIDNIQDVAEQTNDQIKYRVTHTVGDRCRVIRILNADALEDNEKYLQVEVEVLQDKDYNEDVDIVHKDMITYTNECFAIFVELQGRLNETVRFNPGVVNEFNVDREGLWKAISLWKAYMTQITMQEEKKLQANIASIVKRHFVRQGRPIGNEAMRVNFDDLPPAVQHRLNVETRRFQRDVDSLLAGPYPFQRLVEHNSYAERLQLFRYQIQYALDRLSTIEDLKIVLRARHMRGVDPRGDPRVRKRKRRRKKPKEDDDDKDR